MELVFNEKTQKWEERKQPFATIEVETEEDFNRLRELVEADRDGRCVVLPCNVGDILKKDGFDYKADHWNIILSAFTDDINTRSGKRVCLFSVQEAEQALRGMQDG